MAALIATKRRNKPFKNSYPSDGWFRRFVDRHEELAVRKGELSDAARATVTREKLVVLTSEFDKIQ